MADPGRRPEGTPEPEAAKTPRWVWVLGIVLGAIVLLIVVLMLLPGGGHGPGRHAGTGGTDHSGSSAHDPPTEAAGAMRTVEIIAVDPMTFEPDALAVSVGETVRFSVVNADQIVHEFSLGDAQAQGEHEARMEHMPEGMPHDTPSSITLQPGETKELIWQFDEPGIIEYGCHVPGHYDAGMHGRITVQ